jgi:hypothetical protein
MDATVKCSKCGGEMEAGFILDRSGVLQNYAASWVAGKRNMDRYGVDIDWKDKIIPMQSYCYQKCGCVELYVDRKA